MDQETVAVILLKPFVFSHMPNPNSRVPQELRFTPQKDPEAIARGSTHFWMPTQVELPKFVAEHPWVKEHFADGAIERPEVTKARQDAIEAAKAEERKRNEKITKDAEAAFRRSTAGAEGRTAVDKSVEADLNTPVNKLAAKAGKDIDQAAVDRELNTPVDQLQRTQSGK